MNIQYLRISTDKQDIENQKHGMDIYCKEKGIIVDEVISETISGTKSKTVFDVIKDMSGGDKLIIAELSRVSRNMFDIMRIISICIEKKIELHAVKHSMVFRDDLQSKVMAMAFSMAAEVERTWLSDRIKEALARKKSEGVKLGRPEGRQKNVKLSPYDEKIRSWTGTKTALAEELGVSRSELYHYMAR